MTCHLQCVVGLDSGFKDCMYSGQSPLLSQNLFEVFNSLYFLLPNTVWINYWNVLVDCYSGAPHWITPLIFILRVDRPLPTLAVSLPPLTGFGQWNQESIMQVDFVLYAGACFCGKLLGALSHLVRRSDYSTGSIVWTERWIAIF